MSRARSLAGNGLVVAVIGIALLVLIISRPSLDRPSSLPGANAQVTVSAAPAADAPARDVEVVGTGHFAQAADCQSHVEMLDRFTPTIENEASVAETVFVGTVVSVDEPRWDTRDGGRPDSMRVTSRSVYRVVTFGTDAVAKGDPGATIQVRVPGGNVGCEAFIADGIPVDIAKGDRFAVFVQQLAAYDSSEATIATAADMWPVAKDGLVSTPADSKVSEELLVSRASSAS